MRRAGHLVIVEGDQPVVGDGDAVRVAAGVVQDLRRPAEGGFGLDDPHGLAERLEKSGEGVRVAPGGQGEAILRLRLSLNLGPPGNVEPGEHDERHCEAVHGGLQAVAGPC